MTLSTKKSIETIVARVADGNTVHSEQLFYQYRRLRADIFIGNGFLPESSRDDDGGEKLDDDDPRSTHFLCHDGRGQPIGSMRLIHRGQRPLPAETMLGIDDPSPHDYEASRFMAYHADKKVQREAAAKLLGIGLGWQALNGCYIYAVCEDSVLGHFDSLGLVFDSLSEPKELDKYGKTKNRAVRFLVGDSMEKIDHLNRTKSGFEFAIIKGAYDSIAKARLKDRGIYVPA